MLHSKIPIHATVISKNQIGLLLMGNRGTGKTSTAYCLLERGWKLVSDSYSHLFEENGHYWLEGSGKAAKLTFKSPSIFPELQHPEPYVIEEYSPKHNEIRLIVDVDQLFGEIHEMRTELKLCVFPQLTSQTKSQLFSLSVSEAFAIFKQDAWHLHHEQYELTKEDGLFLHRVFEKITCFRLNIGSDWKVFMDELHEIDQKLTLESKLR